MAGRPKASCRLRGPPATASLQARSEALQALRSAGNLMASPRRAYLLCKWHQITGRGR